MDRPHKIGFGALLAAAALTGGALGANFLSVASADTTTATTAADPSQGGHAANGITEALLTGDDAAKVTAAAKEAVPEATVDRVETDAEGAAYEAHMTKADGTHVTVKFNADFSVSGIESGMR